MSLQTRLAALISAVGADVKSLGSRVGTLETGYQTVSGLEIAGTLIVVGNPPVANGTYVTEGAITVPAGSPAHAIELVGGGLCQVVTGTSAINTLFRYDLAIFDEASALVAYSAHHFSQGSTATTKTQQATLPIGNVAAANPSADKTYTLQARVTGPIGSLGATAGFQIGGSFPYRYFRAVAR